MKKILILILLVLPFSTFADYRSTLIDWDAYLTRDGSDYSDVKLQRFIETGHVYHAAVCAAVKMRIYEWTDNTAYSDRAVVFMQAILDYSVGISDSFFLPYPFTEAYVRMKDAGILTSAMDAELTAFAEVNFKTTTINPHAGDIHNQHFARAAGLAYASVIWPNSSKKDSWLEYSTAFFDKVVANGDAIENATNYDYICSFYIWHLADKLGRTDELDDFHEYFTRCADYIAPSGKTPDYGDSGSVTNDSDWFMVNPNAGFRIAAMYRAADFYGDSSLQWAGDEIYQMIVDKEPLEDFGYTAEVPLYAMTYIDDWKSQTIPQRPDFASKITTKRFKTDITAPVTDYEDKLILCQSKQNGNPFLMMDLFTPHGSHTHLNQQVSVNYFEFGGVPLLTTNGYHGWGPESSNLCLIRDTADSFPYPVPQYKAMNWYTTEIPLDNMRSFGPAGQITFDKINFRMNNTSGGTLAGRFDNLRLSGPAGELLIDDFEYLNGWTISGLGSLVSYDKTQGSNSMQIGYTADGTYFNTKSYGITTVDLSQYTHIKLDWKYSNNLTTVRPLIFRLESSEATWMSDFHINFLQMYTKRNKTVVAQTGDISYGSVKCDGYFSHGTKFARRMLMTADGVVIVRDDMLPGSGVAGRNAGPIWNLSSTTQPESGMQWVDSNSGSKELLVYMDSAGAGEYGYQTLDVDAARDNQRAAYTKKVLQAGVGERFMSVLVPHSPSADLNALTSSIVVSQDAAGFDGDSDVTLNVDGVIKTYTIDVLYEDDTTSTVVYGDTAGMMAINAYDKSPQLRTAGALTFNASEAQVSYDVSTGSAQIESFTGSQAQRIEYDGILLLDATAPVDVKINFTESEITGVVDAAAGVTVKVYASIECVNLQYPNGMQILGSYDIEAGQYVFIAGVVDCESVLSSGLTLDADISGPEGDPDCIVDFYDLAEFAKYWLDSLM